VNRFLELTYTPAVLAAQAQAYGRSQLAPRATEEDTLSEAEREFIESRDSFYLASVNESGWPYVQHRGGPRGFLRVTGPQELGFADLRGNRQLLTVGNVRTNDRMCLFLMDYPARTRLKILGRAEIQPPEAAPEGVLLPSATERWIRIRVEAFDWNCPKGITPRYSLEEVESVVGPLRRRIAELEELLRK
jgi:uncharacterized protein